MHRPTHFRRSGTSSPRRAPSGSTSPRSSAGKGRDWWSSQWPQRSSGGQPRRVPGRTAVVAALLGDHHAAAKEFLPALVDGTAPASLVYPVAAPDGSSLAPPGLVGTRRADGSLVVEGTLQPLVNGTVVRLVLAPVQLEGSTLWALLDAGDATAIEGLASFDPLAALGLVDARGCRAPAASDPDRSDGTERIHDLALLVRVRRGGGRRRLVPRGRRGARVQPPPVRQAHRPVPGREAPPGGHAGADRAVGGSDLGRGHLDGRTVRERGRQRGHGTSPPVGAARRLLVARRLRRSCQRHHPGPRRDGVHLGARRARPTFAGPRRSVSWWAARRGCGRGGPPRRLGVRGGRSASSSLPRPTSCRSG